MTKRFATFTSRLAMYLVTLLALAACGGGGGGGTGFLGPDAGDTYVLTLTLRDPGGNTTNNVTTAAPATLEVKVTRNKAGGSAVGDMVVRVNSNLDVLFNGDGSSSQLSDANGMATFTVEAGTAKGAGTITATVSENNQTFTGTLNIQLGATGLRLGRFEDGTFIESQIQITPAGILSSGGQADLTVAIVDENDRLVESAERVRFSSPCLSTGHATLDPANASYQTITGLVSVTYLPGNCAGEDTITASRVGGGTAAFGTVEIAPPTANSLAFISATPTYIVLKGTGTAAGAEGPQRVEQSNVVFRTVDTNGQPLEGVEVTFALSTEVGGLSLSRYTDISDADGNVSTVVRSGDVATVVRVQATAPAGDGVGEVSSVSNQLTVSSGLPDQNSIEVGVISTSGPVVETAAYVSGVTREIIVRMADRFNNPVLDGTAAVFRTEYGVIEPRCETVNGTCSVTWTSQEPRQPTLTGAEFIQTIYRPGYHCPAHNGTYGPCPVNLSLGQLQGYRSTILMTAIGEESFIDRNGNGQFDREEAAAGLFTNLTEAFIDHNDNGLLDPYTTTCLNNPAQLVCRSGEEEEPVDFNANLTFDTNGPHPAYPDQGVEAVYNGLLCPREGDLAFDENGVAQNPDGWCSRSLLNVFASTVVILSDDSWDLGLYRDGTLRVFNTVYGNTYYAYISDQYNNPPPAGSTVGVSADGSCEVEVLDGATVENTYDSAAHTFIFTQSGQGQESGNVTITLNPRGSGSKSWVFPCTPEAPPDPNDLVVSS